MYWRGLSVQSQVIGALLMRELHTRYGRENIGYLWMILEPMILASSVALIHAGQRTSYGSDIRPVPFTIAGYCVFIIFRSIFTRSEGALESNMPLLYHRMVTIFDILASRTVLEGAGISATFAILLGLATSLGLAEVPERPLDLFIGVALMIWFSFGCSMLCCAWTHDNRLAGRIVHPVTYILMPLSGGFYQLKWIPEPYRSYLEAFPMVQIFEQVRYGMFRAASNMYVNLGYVAGWCLILTFFGLIAIKIVRRHVHLH